MTQRNENAREAPAVSDERIRNALRTEISRAITLDHSWTRTALADAAGVNLATIDGILTRDVAKHRRIKADAAFSLAWVLGERAVNALIAAIGFGGARPLDADEDCPLDSAVKASAALSVFLTAAADRRIDHVEERMATEAADMIVAELAPFTSAGRKR